MDCTFLSQGTNWSLNNQHFQHERGVPDMRVPRVLLPPPQKWIFGPKKAKFSPKMVFLAKYWHFWPNIDILGPFHPMPDQKTMRTRRLGDFYDIYNMGTRTFAPSQNS